MPTDPNRRPSLLSRLVRRILLALYRWKGWTLEGRRPDCDKFIILGAPHTSNWDFPLALLAFWSLSIPARWVGKHTIFRWPFGSLMRRLGGIPSTGVFGIAGVGWDVPGIRAGGVAWVPRIFRLLFFFLIRDRLTVLQRREA